MLVFQYGSNCSDREINGNGRLRGDARFIDIAETVEDFELAFDVGAGGAVAPPQTFCEDR